MRERSGGKRKEKRKKKKRNYDVVKRVSKLSFHSTARGPDTSIDHLFERKRKGNNNNNKKERKAVGLAVVVE